MEALVLSQVQLEPWEREVVDDLITMEVRSGAHAIGFFGGRTILGKRTDGHDIDMLIVKDGIRRGGEKVRQGIVDLTYIPSNYKSDPLATFARQVATQAIWVWKQ